MFVFDSDFYYHEYHHSETCVVDGEEKTTPAPIVPEQPLADIKLYSREAVALMRKFTFGRIDELYEKEKSRPVNANNPLWNVYMCSCELTELIYNDKQNGGAESFGVSSERIGNWQKTYVNSNERTQSFNRLVKSIIHKWLPSYLLYRGVEK
jgi:hypothetical protein